MSDWEKEYHRLGLWFPVFLGLGIVCYFSLSVEPPLIWGGGGVIVSLLIFSCVRKTFVGRPLATGLLAICLGFFLSQYRTYQVDPHMLNKRLSFSDLEGTVTDIEHLSEDSYRVTLGSLKADNVSLPRKIPKKIRLTMREVTQPLWTGQRLQVRAKLYPFSDPVSPHAYDFRRQSFFKGLGATGYSRGPVKILENAQQPLFDNLRHTMTRAFLRQLPEPLGGIAAALITGDKASLPSTTRQYFADAGLAHVLAISGLHLSIVAGFFFFMVQGTLVLVPGIGLRFPLHKIAAVCSLAGTFCYLLISGGGVPAQRSFLMTAFVMVAILTDRKALTMRVVAIAATVILMFSPEALLGPSFQLSFAAVIALVAAYESGGPKINNFFQKKPSFFKKIFYFFMGSLYSTLVATLATTPFTIMLFNRWTLQGMVANLLAIPLVSFIIMPCAVIVCFLMPFQAQEVILPVFKLSLKILDGIAQHISTWPGAVILAPRPPGIPYLSLVISGGLWLCLLKNPYRWLGIIPVVGAFLTFIGVRSPDLWVAPQSQALGYYDRQTDTLWYTPGQDFIAEQWMKENMISRKKPFSQRHFFIPEKKILLAQDALWNPLCKTADIVISQKFLGKKCAQAYLRLDLRYAWKKGSCTIWLNPSPVIQTGKQVQGRRPWSRP